MCSFALADELDFVVADPLLDVRDYPTPNGFVSAEDDALFTLFDSILGANTVRSRPGGRFSSILQAGVKC